MKYYIEVKKIGESPLEIVRRGKEPLGFPTRDAAEDHAIDTVKGSDINYWEVIDEDTARENYRFPKFPQIVDPKCSDKLENGKWIATIDYGDQGGGFFSKRIKQTIISDEQYQKYLKNTNEGLVQEEI